MILKIIISGIGIVSGFVSAGLVLHLCNLINGGFGG